MGRISTPAQQTVWGPAMAVVAMAFFLRGLVVATDRNWTGAAEAARLGPRTPEGMAARPIPGSFAALVQQLTPTVVNIKVAQMAPAGQLSWPQMPDGPLEHFLHQPYNERHQARRYQAAGAHTDCVQGKKNDDQERQSCPGMVRRTTATPSAATPRAWHDADVWP